MHTHQVSWTLVQVDYTGFSTVNSQKFGQRFVGKVANPHDMLLWTKAAQRKYVTACLPCLPACPASLPCLPALPACLPHWPKLP